MTRGITGPADLDLAHVLMNLMRKSYQGVFPSPLWGGARGGGQCFWTQRISNCDPPPQPSPTRGEGAGPLRGASRRCKSPDQSCVSTRRVDSPTSTRLTSPLAPWTRGAPRVAEIARTKAGVEPGDET